MASRTQQMIFTAVFTALTAIGAFIKIPIPPYPVPMTLQTAFLFLAGLLLPARGAFFSQLTYVLLGLIGIPIFTNGGGIGYIFDPTFGYLLAFLVVAPTLRIFAEKTLYNGKKLRFAVFALGLILFTQLCGVCYMALISAAYLGKPLTFSYALYLALIFIPLDALKLTVASALALQLRKRVPKLFAQAPAKN